MNSEEAHEFEKGEGPNKIAGEPAKVYVTNHSGFNYEAAAKYGELIYMTRGYLDYRPEKVSVLIKKLASIIDEADQNDYLCLSGNAFICAICLYLWSREHNICKVLHWNPVKRDYDLYPMAL